MGIHVAFVLGLSSGVPSLDVLSVLVGGLAMAAVLLAVLWGGRPSDPTPLGAAVVALGAAVQGLAPPAVFLVLVGGALVARGLVPRGLPPGFLPGVVVAGLAGTATYVLGTGVGPWAASASALVLAGATARGGVRGRSRPGALPTGVAWGLFTVATVVGPLGLSPELTLAGLGSAVVLVSLAWFRRLGADFAAAERTAAQQAHINRSLGRFLPAPVLGLLDKQAVDLELGDHRQHCLSVMCLDIRNFPRLSRSMGPDENFRFLNSYLRRMGPVVRRHDGVVERYLGEGLLVLFPGDPCRALEAALDVRAALGEYNGHRAKCGYPPVEIGIGIHRGPVLVGTVGENNRWEPTVISDAVQAATGLEVLASQWGRDILVSGETVEALGPDAQRFGLEFLREESVEGLVRPLQVYEVHPRAS